MPDIDEGSSIDMRKGERVVLKNGASKKFPKYISAFIDKARKATVTLQPVIVMTRDGSYHLFRPKKKNVERYEGTPGSRTAAAFQQHPRIDELMNSLVQYMASCQIDRTHDDGYVLDRFAHALDTANNAYNEDITLPIRRVAWPIRGDNSV